MPQILKGIGGGTKSSELDVKTTAVVCCCLGGLRDESCIVMVLLQPMVAKPERPSATAILLLPPKDSVPVPKVSQLLQLACSWVPVQSDIGFGIDITKFSACMVHENLELLDAAQLPMGYGVQSQRAYQVSHVG